MAGRSGRVRECDETAVNMERDSEIRRLEDEVAFWRRQWEIVYEDAEFLRTRVRELLRKQEGSGAAQSERGNQGAR